MSRRTNRLLLAAGAIAMALAASACGSAEEPTTTVTGQAPEVVAAETKAKAVEADLAAAEQRVVVRDRTIENLNAKVAELEGNYADVRRNLELTQHQYESEKGRYSRLKDRFDELTDEAKAAVEAVPEVPKMEQSKGSGFYRVGVSIAPGVWTSTGSGDGCYWERLDDDQEILDNHFGNAGGSVKIRATDFEVHFQDCGRWEFQG